VAKERKVKVKERRIALEEESFVEEKSTEECAIHVHGPTHDRCQIKLVGTTTDIRKRDGFQVICKAPLNKLLFF
jgi:hypothetical protein